jgi:hypothetical protein
MPLMESKPFRWGKGSNGAGNRDCTLGVRTSREGGLTARRALVHPGRGPAARLPSRNLVPAFFYFGYSLK